MEIETKNNTRMCKYCDTLIQDWDSLPCHACKGRVHLNCLKRGAVPGGLVGDVFFQFTCYECSLSGGEHFVRDKMPWLQAILLVLYHMQPALFQIGTALFNEQGWWTLTYPKLTPNIIVQLNSELMSEKQKLRENKLAIDDVQLLRGILLTKPYVTEEMLQIATEISVPEEPQPAKVPLKRKKLLLPTIASLGMLPTKRTKKNNKPEVSKKVEELAKYLDPMCHYNTSLDEYSRLRSSTMRIRLMGNVRKDPILSPYTSIFLPPYIRRDTKIRPPWLQLMDELKAKVLKTRLPKRLPLDFVYIQPEHIPAVNSLCNHFFWTGIDVSDTLKYPDFSCVVMYGKLIVGFAFVIPDVKFNECYITFIFTRPGWRNCGIAKFMLYHLIQTSLGRDITLHVSISNSALFLYQKFGFKVETVALDFYNRYIQDDARESKHAFFCRLER
ncbi:hypothetical protein FQR65_LT14495 [Abscondita terminalis]|nr:hypothetical protein FQR65_LT14495 [Abscondita terminalis]